MSRRAIWGAYDALFTKSADWAYEAEWRLIAEERAFARSSRTIKTDNDFLLIPPGVLKSVSLHARGPDPQALGSVDNDDGLCPGKPVPAA
jgi:hypothetical protein